MSIWHGSRSKLIWVVLVLDAFTIPSSIDSPTRSILTWVTLWPVPIWHGSGEKTTFSGVPMSYWHGVVSLWHGVVSLWYGVVSLWYGVVSYWYGSHIILVRVYGNFSINISITLSEIEDNGLTPFSEQTSLNANHPLSDSCILTLCIFCISSQFIEKVEIFPWLKTTSIRFNCSRFLIARRIVLEDTPIRSASVFLDIEHVVMSFSVCPLRNKWKRIANPLPVVNVLIEYGMHFQRLSNLSENVLICLYYLLCKN